MNREIGYVIVRYRTTNQCAFQDVLIDGEGVECFGYGHFVSQKKETTIFGLFAEAQDSLSWFTKSIRMKFLNIWEVEYTPRKETLGTFTGTITRWIKKIP